ncbi:hypothetical protein [Acinetobacter indicus]|uniref:hypothetical protein n=1 Tax=Acinetobacter indicus TaxID=756892 RepID=UPI0032B5B056
MAIGVPYRDALDMQLDMALALLSPNDERPKNTRQASTDPAPQPARTPVKRPGKTFIASRFKNAQKSKT